MLLWIGCTNKGFSQNNVIDSLLSSGDFESAAIEFERLIMLEQGGRTKLLISKANCYKKLKRFDKVNRTLARLDISALPTDTLQIVKYDQAFACYMLNELQEADLHLKQAEAQVYRVDTNLIFLHILVLNELRNWEEARTQFESLRKVTLVKDSIQERINVLYQNPPKLKSVSKAVMYSSFLPGTGQMYAGYVGEGLANTMLELASLSLGAYAAFNKLYVTGFVFGYGMFQKFYTGGQNRVEYLVNKRNYERSLEYNNKLKDLLLKLKA